MNRIGWCTLQNQKDKKRDNLYPCLISHWALLAVIVLFEDESSEMFLDKVSQSSCRKGY